MEILGFLAVLVIFGLAFAYNAWMDSPGDLDDETLDECARLMLTPRNNSPTDDHSKE